MNRKSAIVFSMFDTRNSPSCVLSMRKIVPTEGADKHYVAALQRFRFTRRELQDLRNLPHIHKALEQNGFTEFDSCNLDGIETRYQFRYFYDKEKDRVECTDFQGKLACSSAWILAHDYDVLGPKVFEYLRKV